MNEGCDYHFINPLFCWSPFPQRVLENSTKSRGGPSGFPLKDSFNTLNISLHQVQGFFTVFLDARKKIKIGSLTLGSSNSR